MRARLIVLFALVSMAAVAAAVLMVLLFRQSTAAQLGQAQAEVERGCEAIENTYRFFIADWRGPFSEAEKSRLSSELRRSSRSKARRPSTSLAHRIDGSQASQIGRSRARQENARIIWALLAKGGV